MPEGNQPKQMYEVRVAKGADEFTPQILCGKHMPDVRVAEAMGYAVSVVVLDPYTPAACKTCQGIIEAMVREREDLPAACPRCGGWTAFGGMSQHASGPNGCKCTRG